MIEQIAFLHPIILLSCSLQTTWCRLAMMLPLISQLQLPFLVHDAIAIFAGLTFIFRPSAQLRPLTPGAELILQCYGGMILFTCLISLIFFRRPFDETSRLVALAFAFWHLWPSYRAVVRLQRGIDTEGPLGRTLGGPAVHLTVHVILVAMFVRSAITGEA